MQTLIIGGGLSGLALAHELEEQGHDYVLLEARSRFGGRIMTEHFDGGDFDMGPAWFWPAQPRIARWVDKLELEKFDQFSDGDLAYENEHGQVQRGRGISSMEGSWRLKGGLGALTKALADKLPSNRKRLNAVVTKLAQTDAGVTATLSNGDTISAEQVVLSLPPRVAANITYEPALTDDALGAMQNISTWMAGQAKAVAVYDTPFWRDDGLSGDAQSRFGPMVEIHDASPAHGGPYALFGFIGVPPDARADEQALRQHLTAQLTRLFGPQATNPTQLYVKDWAIDPYTATEADKAPLYAHPTYGLPQVLAGLWDNRLHFSGTEVAPQFGGYLEGALEAAENTLTILEI
ncbi:MAG: NAD(P)/FAD-dependent oxidoreductase [Litoreibacter sp.]|uniref:flavin monoamine oxidase family protein n=1 Tax=Litoreibacter sp. TaxID=1969459 RepID=UPI00329687F4